LPPAAGRILPPILIGGLAGLRPAGIQRLDLKRIRPAAAEWFLIQPQPKAGKWPQSFLPPLTVAH
jgi:hypothetical protein